MRAIETDKQYSQRVKKAGGDEVGQLIDSFNAMLEQIELRDKKLRAHRNELEQQVQTRTQELVQTNASLWQAVSELEMPVRIWPMPSEVPDPIRFDEDTVRTGDVFDVLDHAPAGKVEHRRHRVLRLGSDLSTAGGEEVPVEPQRHGRPSGLTGMWPTSPL